MNTCQECSDILSIVHLKCLANCTFTLIYGANRLLCNNAYFFCGEVRLKKTTQLYLLLIECCAEPFNQSLYANSAKLMGVSDTEIIKNIKEIRTNAENSRFLPQKPIL